ncbi:aa3-type cytochrome c oxidase subunit IV [Brevundimonas sp.]|uniref:aa3-type cytochrome c oxidase subunit IV n=1 Tax=Brevundimonas sp. TaxID=1871086 RepID=UPI00261F1F87|nr:aa3-type cytochrome c oxidase subunit IV [Brevundimonas sp.]
MAEPHADHDYQRGTQDIAEQRSTFSLVMGMTKWGSLAVAVALLFLVMWFQPGGNFFTALIAAGVVAVAGILVLRDKPGTH